MCKKIGKMLIEVTSSLFKKPATSEYPFKKREIHKSYSGKIAFDKEKCIVKMTPSGMLCAPLKTIEGEEEAPYPLYKFTAICDTEEEARMLQEFSCRCRAEMNAMRERHNAEAAKLVKQ